MPKLSVVHASKPAAKPRSSTMLASAAHLVAAIESNPAGSAEVLDSLRMLREELDAAGWLEPYKVGAKLRVI